MHTPGAFVVHTPREEALRYLISCMCCDLPQEEGGAEEGGEKKEGEGEAAKEGEGEEAKPGEC